MLNYGNFFRLNNKKSDLGKGIAVFDYIWLRDNENDNDSSEFPVYVTISKDSIDFHAHYHNDYTDTNGKHTHKHLHNTILSLPLSANLDVKDGLTGALVEGFKTNFPRYNKDGSNYLFKLLLKIILKERKIPIDYSSLAVFGENNKNIIQLFFEKLGLDYNAKDYNCKDFIKAIRTAYRSEKLFKCFIRKLILDFMFDLEQTKVFQTSPHYEHISIKLKENYFFSALAAKANFYYWPEIIEEKLKEKEDSESQLSELTVYAEYYLKAKMQWEKAIRSPKAEENFNGYEDKWFDDPEIEMKNVYKVEILKESVERLKKENEPFWQRLMQNNKLSHKWRIAHYDFFFRKDKWCKNYHWFIFSRIFISIAAVWLTFILGSNLWGNLKSDSFIKINPDSYNVWYFCVALCLASPAWLAYLGIKNKIKFSKIWHIICGGAAYMAFWGFIYSAVIGGFLRVFAFEKECSNYDYNIHCSCCYWFGEQSHFYWVGVCLAVFSGIVIQSFMDKKMPAEEL